MPTIIVVCLIVYLFWRDLNDAQQSSSALWIPFAWMFLAGSRYASSWLNIGPVFSSVSDYSEGSPVDAAVFLSLIFAGVVVLSRRSIDWAQLLQNNIWIVLYFAYCLTSMAWSDEPLILAKRWIKDLGNPIMALVMLTEARPYEAVGLVLRRLCFVLLPLSVLFIRYYPELGRVYRSNGDAMYVGVGHQKNDLGLICLMCGIYIAWEFLRDRAPGSLPLGRYKQFVLGCLFPMLLWLLRMSDSQTAVVCLAVAVAVIAIGRLPMMKAKPEVMVGLPLAGGLFFWTLNELFDVKDQLLLALGRDPTLTNRTEIWDIVRRHEVDQLIGTGFMSFWSGKRADQIAEEIGAAVNQAHNGYLEQYLNLGMIGLALIVMILVISLLNIRRHMARDAPNATLRLVIVIVAILYNFTEASFYGMSNMWLLLLAGCVEVPYRTHDVARPFADLNSVRRSIQTRRRIRAPAVARRRIPVSRSCG